MTNVLVVCGAGASSSFLVHWLRRQAAGRGLELTFTAGSVQQLAAQLETADAVLLGSHLAADFERVRAAASVVHARALLLPAVSFDATGADTALDLLLTETEPEPESSSHA